MSRGRNARKRLQKKHRALTMKGLKKNTTFLGESLGIENAISAYSKSQGSNKGPFSL